MSVTLIEVQLIEATIRGSQSKYTISAFDKRMFFGLNFLGLFLFETEDLRSYCGYFPAIPATFCIMSYVKIKLWICFRRAPWRIILREWYPNGPEESEVSQDMVSRTLLDIFSINCCAIRSIPRNANADTHHTRAYVEEKPRYLQQTGLLCSLLVFKLRAMSAYHRSKRLRLFLWGWLWGNLGIVPTHSGRTGYLIVNNGIFCKCTE